MFEQRPDIGFHAFLTQPADQTDRQQRVPTQFKEMIVAPTRSTLSNSAQSRARVISTSPTGASYARAVSAA